MITIRHRIVQSFKDVWKPAVIFMLLFAICIALHVIAISVISMFTRRNKRCVKMNNFFRRVSIQTLDLVMRIMRIKLRSAEENLLREAENILNEEFAFVLEIPKSDVPDYIRNHV